MNLKNRCINQKFILIIFVIFIINSLRKTIFVEVKQSSVPYKHNNSIFKKVSIAHYTTLYGIRTDSNTTIFNNTLKQICHILDPEDYQLADSVIVSLVDLDRLPILLNELSYRNLHQSQLWVVYSEESPRNSYIKIDTNQIEALDNWFNLSSTLKPESDFHIQYRVCIS